MNSELLREAATLMRQRAEAATPGPWVHTPKGGAAIVAPNGDPEGDEVRYYGHEVIAESTRKRNDDHIRSWHPAVALAVADWLDDEAAGLQTESGRPTAHAVAVARVYLGKSDG